MKMRDYVIRRILLIIPVIIGVTFIMFVLTYRMASDPAEYLRALERADVDPETIEAIKRVYGFDKPWYTQYYLFLKRLARGQLGNAFRTGRPVIQEIVDRTPNTLSYQLTALVLSIFIAVPVGVTCAIHQNTRTDSYAMMGALLGASLPTFFTGLLFIYVFSLFLGWLPSGGAHANEFFGWDVPHDIHFYVDYLKHMILPALTLALAITGYTARLVRSSMLSVLKEDYIITARSKGLKERVVIYKHALKNAMLPIMTVLGLRMGFMLSGAPIIETVFAWPGLGKFFLYAIGFRDYPTAVGITVVLGLMVVFINVFVDLSYKILDPRVEL
jgi:ABC-type dipeptide/oligopeptide/nickel transport system permease component